MSGVIDSRKIAQLEELQVCIKCCAPFQNNFIIFLLQLPDSVHRKVEKNSSRSYNKRVKNKAALKTNAPHSSKPLLINNMVSRTIKSVTSYLILVFIYF